MKKVLKWIAIVLAAVLGLIVLAAAGLYTKTRLEYSKKYSPQVETVAIPTDAASIEHGRHLATVLCMECHQDDLGGGKNVFDLGAIGSMDLPNLTSGEGGVGAEFSDEDFVRVLRHGVKPDGRSVFVMPATDFARMTDEDLGALIAYLRAAPPVDRPVPEPHLHFTVLGNIMYGAGMFGNLFRASTLAEAQPPHDAPQPSVSAEYGRYLVDINGCRDCHGQQLAGGKPGDPNSMFAPNLTPGGVLKYFSEEDFLTTLKTGTLPSGGKLPNEFMPWKYKGQMTDDELKAVFAYIQSLPPLPTSYEPAE